MNEDHVGLVTDTDFASTIHDSQLPVLVKFEAPWCAPCKAMQPLIREIAADYAGQLTVVRLDVEQNAQAAQRAGVRAVPTLMLFKNGSVLGQHVGMPNRPQLVTLIERALRQAVAD